MFEVYTRMRTKSALLVCFVAAFLCLLAFVFQLVSNSGPDARVRLSHYLKGSAQLHTSSYLVDVSEPNSGNTSYRNQPVSSQTSNQHVKADSNMLDPSITSKKNRADVLSFRSEHGLNNHDPQEHCCNYAIGITLDELCASTGVFKLAEVAEKATMQRCTCINFFYCKLVVVTAFSSSHYEEAQDMIASVQHFLPNTKLIVYDLGMTVEQRKNVSNDCNVELRQLDYTKYPPHVKLLGNYAWKPVIAGEVAEQYEVFMWGDASVRVVGSLVKHVLPLLQNFPFVAGSAFSGPIIPLIHDGMIHYLNFTLSRMQMRHFGHIEANCWVIWINTMMRNRFLGVWVDCALHKECISPPGSKGGNCRKERHQMIDQIRRGEYIGCHRYDQAAMDLILVREFGLQVWNSVVHDVRRTIFRVNRWPTNFYHVQNCM